MKLTNHVKIATALESFGPLGFTEILWHTGIKSSAARSAIHVLLQDGTIVSNPTPKVGKMGRPPVCYAIQEIR